MGPGSYTAKHIIVATGARPRVLPGIEPDNNLIWTYYEAIVPDRMPRSLPVIGSGTIGVEFASFYRTMGAEVTIVEVLPQILPIEDAEIAGIARKRFEKQGIVIITDAQVTRVDKSADQVTATIQEGSGKSTTLTVDRVISAVGVVGNVENLAGTARCQAGSGHDCCRRVRPHQRTGIYAIGDVAGPPMLSHKASHEGVICIETIKGLPTHALDKAMIPGCTYCQPQIASVGLVRCPEPRRPGYNMVMAPLPRPLSAGRDYRW